MIDELYKEHGAYLVSYLCGRHQIHDAENILQDTWLKVIKHYRPEHEPYARRWILHIAKNTQKDFFKKKQPAASDPVTFNNLTDPTQRELLLQQTDDELVEIYKACINDLPEPNLSIIWDRVQRIPQAKTAKKFGRSVPWVANRARVSMDAVKDCIKKKYGEEI